MLTLPPSGIRLHEQQRRQNVRLKHSENNTSPTGSTNMKQ